MTEQHDIRQGTAGRRPLALLALTCGVAVGNIYFPQAISPSIAAGLHVTPDAAALVVTATQFGYAAGIFLLVPLGDRLPHRRLIVTLLGLTGLGLLAAGVAPALPPLVAAAPSSVSRPWSRRSSARWRPGWWPTTVAGWSAARC